MNIEELKKEAREIRILILRMLANSGSGHTAGSLGMTDVLTTLYFNILKIDPKNSDWEDRDRLVLSNGHICPALYATMARRGFFPESELLDLRKFGSPLQGHPHREWLNGLETSSGPLGSGLSQAIGMALALRLKKIDNPPYVFCLMSDGELQEGNSWEAIMLASKEKLSRLIAVVDNNGIQISGKIENVMPIEPLSDKWRAFGWNVIETDGNDIEKILKAFEDAKNEKKLPTVILAKTISGKGFLEAEGKYEWHGKAPSLDESEKAIEEIKKYE